MSRTALRVYLSPPYMGDREFLLLEEAFRSMWIAPLGPHVDALEKECAGVVGSKDSVAVSSGTAALHIGLLLLGAEHGDRAVTASKTSVATANAIKYQGAEPVLVDSDVAMCNMDPQLPEGERSWVAWASELPKAVLVVDVNGQGANYRALGAICERYEVPYLEDAAETLGPTSDGRPVDSG